MVVRPGRISVGLVLALSVASVAEPAVTGSARAATAVGCLAPATTVTRAQPAQQHRLSVERVWPLTQGRGITVAVIDTGVDAAVPQLRGQVLRGVDLLRDRGGTDGGTDGGRADTDCAGHGTFVAGIIAARPAATTGFAGFAPQSRILPVRHTEDPGARVSPTDLGTAIRAAVDGGAQVVNISTVAFHPTVELRSAVRYALDRNVLIVAAANKPELGEPAADRQVLNGIVSVGGIGLDGSTPEGAGGPVDVVAPAVQVVSTGPGGPGHLSATAVGYAAPFVSATAALIRSYHPELTAAQVKRRLLLTAEPPGTSQPDDSHGWGMVDPYAAVTAVLPDEAGTSQVGERPRPRAVQPSRPVSADTGARDIAWGVVSGAGALVLLLLVVAVTFRHGRRRGWRAAGA